MGGWGWGGWERGTMRNGTGIILPVCFSSTKDVAVVQFTFRDLMPLLLFVD